MNRQEFRDYVCQRASQLIEEYLGDPSNYPPAYLGGVMFFDDITAFMHSTRNIYRNPEHLIDNWHVDVEYDKGYKCKIRNSKFVGGINLLDQILETGTKDYEVPLFKKPMTYFNRYANKWFFNVYKRKGIDQGWATSIKKLQKDAAIDGLSQAMDEVIDDLED